MSYKILARDGRPVKKDGDPVRAMDLTVEKIESLDDNEKSFIAIASTEDEDRDKDIIRQDGWDLKNFKKNPMVPWSHNYWGIPVAKSLRTWVDKTTKKLMFKPKFDADDDDSIKVFNKYKNGFLTSFSVGFRGIEYESRDNEDPWWGGKEFTKQELLEISGVTVPANPNAVILQNDVSDSQKNLLQLGYPQQYAKTDQGLFYPIREELGEFINPEVKTVEGNEDVEGIQSVCASIISEKKEDGSVGELITIGYYFDPEKWTTGEIKSWINDNNEKTYKSHYYNWKWLGSDNDEKKTFEITEGESEKSIPDFDEPKVLTSAKISSDDKTVVIDDPDLQTNEKSQEEIILELGKAIEELIGEQMLKMADGLATGFDLVFDKILVELDGIKKLITEKGVASPPKINDNDDDPDKSKSHADDEIEIDDSLISPDDDKSNSDEDIEIDDDVLGEKEVAKTVNSVFRQRLKEIFKSEKTKKAIN
jgi:HK97 family phage prohead protease